MSTQIASLYASISADLKPLNASLAEAQNKIQGAGNSIKMSFGGALSVFGGNLMTGALNGLASLGKAAVGMGKAAVGMAIDFESQMSILAIAASSTGLTFEQLHDAAMKVGGDTQLVGVSAADSAAALTGLYKAGLSTTEIFGDMQGYMAGTTDLGGALRAAIDLAAASELDMVQASDLAAVALATFGSEMVTEEDRAGFITDAMDNLVKAADASVAEVGDLAAALANIGPTAAAMGLSLQDTNNALAILSTRGIAGAEAGTALKSMLTNMQRQTGPVTDAWRELGIQLYDAEGNMRSLPGIIGDLENAFEGMTQEQKNQYIQTLAGTYGMNAMNALLGEGVDGWEDMAKATENAAGIQEQAAAKANTFAGAWESFQGTIETVGIGIGEAFLPVLKSLANAFSGFVEEYGPSLVSFFSELGGWLAEVLPVAIQGLAKFWTGTLLPALTGVWGFIQTNVLPIFAQLWSWLQTAIPSAIGTLGGIWTTVLQPALATVWDIIQNQVIPVFMTLWSWLQSALPLAIQVISDYWNTYLLPIFSALAEQWTTVLQPALAELWSWLQEVLPVALQFLSDMWTNTLQPALAVFSEFMTGTIIPLLGELAAWLIENIPVALEFLGNLWANVVWPAITKAIQFFTNTVIPIWTTIINWLKVVIPVALAYLKTIWTQVVWPAIQEAVDLVWSYVEPIWESIKVWFETTLPDALETLRGWWVDDVWPALQDAVSGVWEFLEPIWNSIKTWFDETLPNALEVLRAMWEDHVWPAIQSVIEGVWAIIGPIFEELKKWLDENIPVVLENLRHIWEDVVWPAISGALEAAWEIIKPIWDAVKEWLDTTLGTAAETAKGAFENAWTAIKDAVSGAWDIVGGIFDSIKAFGDWLAGKTFSFKIKLPKIPSWATPGSDIPLHAAWKDFANFINTATIEPDIEVDFGTISMITEFFDLAEEFWLWLNSKVFRFRIEVPKLPNVRTPIDLPQITTGSTRRWTRGLVEASRANTRPVTVEQQPNLSVHTVNLYGVQNGRDLIRELQGLTVAPMRV